MRKGLRNIIAVAMVTASIFAGCSNNNTTSNNQTTVANSDVTTDTNSGTTTQTTTGSTSATAITLSSTSEILVDTEYKAKDLEVGYEDTTATHIALQDNAINISGNGASADNSVLTITEEGTYVITGTLQDGQIVIDTKDTAKVRLVLNGVGLHNQDNAPIYIKNADKVYLTLAEGTENTLTDAATYSQTDDNAVDGVIYSMADLTINGEGSLTIEANYKHGIVSKDSLVITSGTIDINAAKDAINGKDCVKINDGTLTLNAPNGDGIQSKNSDDTTKGYVYISGGDITVTASLEGIEGTAIIISGGNINVTARDDGFNAASGSTTSSDNTATMGRGGFGGGGQFENDTNAYISITGGNIDINASGDGIDSNGSVFVTGGTTYVSGPTDNGNGGFDYNGTADISGGTFVVAGSSGMAQGFSESSTQYSVLNNLTTTASAGTEIVLKDSEGKVVVSFTPDKQYQSVVISSPELLKDATYTLICGEESAELTLSSIVTSNGQAGFGGMGMPGGRGQRPDGAMPARDGADSQW